MKRTRKSLLTIIAVLAFLSSYGMMSYAEDETCFVGGTSVNGVKISDMTPEEAAQSLADYYSGSYQLALITKEGTKEYITASSIGYQVSLGGDPVSYTHLPLESMRLRKRLWNGLTGCFN